MLVLHPNSQCDVCLDGYYGTKEPLVINCGHIFCQRCLQSLPRPLCPLCRLEFRPADVRKLHVDKTALPPSTPAYISVDLGSPGSHARRLRAGITRVVLSGATVAEVRELLSEVHSWLNTQPVDEHNDLRAAYRLLYRYTDVQNKLVEERRRVADVEQNCSDLKAQLEHERDDLHAQLQEERDHAAAKYEELEQKAFDEREVLLTAEKKLKEEKERLEQECDEWRAKCDNITTECQLLQDELEKIKRKAPSRPVEPRYFYLHDQSGTKAEPLAVFKDEGLDSTSTLKVQIAGKDNIFHLSPVPKTQPFPDLASTMMSFPPLTDDLDDPIDDEKTRTGSNGITISSASRSIPIHPRSDSHREHSRSNSGLLARHDPDAMSVSAPRGTFDVHMSSCSTSPGSMGSQYGPRSTDSVSSSYGRVPENTLGLRASPPRSSPPTLDPLWKEKEQQLNRDRAAALREVLQHPSPATAVKSPRKGSISEGYERERERARAAVPSAISSTRTPSPVSTASYGYTGEKEYGGAPIKSQLLAPPPSGISSASLAAAERERARASSVNSQNAPQAAIPLSSVPPQNPAPAMSSTSLSHVTATRDRDTTTPAYSNYTTAPPTQSYPNRRASQSRRQSTDNHSSMSNLSGSLSKGKAAAMGVVPPPPYTSNLTRSMRAMPEPPRVS